MQEDIYSEFNKNLYRSDTPKLAEETLGLNQIGSGVGSSDYIPPDAIDSGASISNQQLVSGRVESGNFKTGSNGWRLTAAGDFEANSGTFRGALNASSLIIPGGSFNNPSGYPTVGANTTYVGYTPKYIAGGSASEISLGDDGSGFIVRIDTSLGGGAGGTIPYKTGLSVLDFSNTAGNPDVIIGDFLIIPTTAISGFLYIPRCAGTPTGVPNLPTGKVPIIYDSTNNRLYVYNGGWKSSLFA